jgi:hypothetical protein
MNGGIERKIRREPPQPEISWTFTPRIDPGEYWAYSRSAALYWDKQFKRWVCAVQFDVLDGSLINVLGRLTWYLNLGSRDRPRAGRRTKYWEAWIRANGGQPKRKDRLSHRVFERRHAVVRVDDTKKDHRQNVIGVDECYSVVRDVVEWRGASRSAEQVRFRTRSNNQSNHLSRQA